MAHHRRRHRRGGARLVHKVRAVHADRPRPTASRTATSRSTTAPARACNRCGRRSAAGRRATTTVRSTGARMPDVRRVGHKGADLIAPGNTPASFDAALAARCRHDRVRRPARGPRATRATAGSSSPTTTRTTSRTRRRSRRGSSTSPSRRSPTSSSTSTSSSRLRGPRASPPCAEHGLLERTLVSTMEHAQPRPLRALEPALRLGWSVPKARRDYTRVAADKSSRLPRCFAARAPFLPAAPARARAGLLRRDHGLLAARHAAARQPRARRGRRALRLDGRRRRAIAQLERMGVTGVITNDPRAVRRLR